MNIFTNNILSKHWLLTDYLLCTHIQIDNEQCNNIKYNINFLTLCCTQTKNTYKNMLRHDLRNYLWFYSDNNYMIYIMFHWNKSTDRNAPSLPKGNRLAHTLSKTFIICIRHLILYTETQDTPILLPTQITGNWKSNRGGKSSACTLWCNDPSERVSAMRNGFFYS